MWFDTEWSLFKRNWRRLEGDFFIGINFAPILFGICFDIQDESSR